MGTTTFGQQANALWRKNWSFQRRSCASNCCLLSAPIIFVGILGIIQGIVNVSLLGGPDYKCGCKCIECCPDSGKSWLDYEPGVFPQDGSCVSLETGTCPGTCHKRDKSQCGFQYSTEAQSTYCAIPDPDFQPAFMQLPDYKWRAMPAKPGVTFLSTGSDPIVVGQLSSRLFSIPRPTTMLPALEEAAAVPDFSWLGPGGRGLSDAVLSMITDMGLVLGTSSDATNNLYIEKAFTDDNGVELLLPDDFCKGFNLTWQGQDALNQTINLLELFVLTGVYYSEPVNATYVGGIIQQLKLGALRYTCTDAVVNQQPTSAAVNEQLYCGFRKARCGGVLENKQLGPSWDFGSSTNGSLDLTLWYNLTDWSAGTGARGPTERLLAPINLAVNAWLRWYLGDEYGAEVVAVASMPKPGTKLSLDFSSLLGPLFYTWVVQMLLPTILVQLVYDKEHKLRMMMKMHGLGDASYWAITYTWYLILYILYIIIYLIFGSAIQLNIFLKNSYGIQIIFYFLFGNCMIAFAALMSCFFDNSRTAVVVAFLYTFGSGLIGNLLLETYWEQNKNWTFFVEWIPAFGLYRGLWELGQYAFLAKYRNGDGMQFSNLQDDGNGMVEVWGIFIVEWFVFMILAVYLEQVYASGTGVRRHPLFFLEWLRPKVSQEPAGGADAGQRDELVGKMMGELRDVADERQRVMALRSYDNHPIVIKDLRKVYPSQDGRPPKLAVRSMSLAVEKGECFGLLGPNGAGKSTAINMMVGFLDPSGGTAYVSGFNIRTSMQRIYGIMGVCPQHDLLWERLTGREHLMFYGRLKGLQNQELVQAVDAGLKSVNLFNNKVGDKLSSQYSGGMKRRLSVAISMIGSPAVVYLDEPSTGLDPASRRNLWDVVKNSKSGRAIILTTHSMEEAEVLCDRLGIFVDGQLVCIGNPRELTSRYGGYYVFTLMVPADQERAATELVTRMSPSARLTYHVGGTFKYELPSTEVTLSTIFATMSDARNYMTVLDWGVASATLEEVFIKFARQIGARAAELEGESGRKANGNAIARALRSCCGP